MRHPGAKSCAATRRVRVTGAVPLTDATARGGTPVRLHLLHVFPTFAVGGVQLRMAEIINHFGPKYRHTILSLDGRDDARSRLRADVDWGPAAVPGAGPFGLVSRVLGARGLVAERRPDLLLTYNWGAIEWALTARLFRPCRHLHLESGFGSEEANAQLRRRVWFRRAALAPPSLLIVPSRRLVDLATKVWRLDPGMIRYIPNGVDVDKFASPPRAGAIPGFQKRTGEVLVGTIAPLRQEKNIARLIRAFSAVARIEGPDTRLVIVGDGPERGMLERLVESLGLSGKVLFAGHTETPEAAIGWFDLYALSSDTEQMPNTVLQAMAAGLPVAGLDVGDVAHVLSPSNRPYIAPAGDEAGLADAVSRLRLDPAARKAVGMDNRKRARAEYALERMCRAYEAVFGGEAVSAPVTP
ncbi:MAG: glycosyltransferase [Alphaproteobacteria bacterium]